MCSLSVIGSGPILGPLAGPAGDAPVLPTDTDTCTDADMRETRGVFLMRVALPDRPGSLGAVASALGTVKADIVAVEIVEKYEGYAIDDFMLHLPAGVLPDGLITACTAIEGVEVMWLSYYPESWGLQADVDVLNEMLERPRDAERILTDASPDVFHVNWALLVDREYGSVEARTALAPELTPSQVTSIGGLAEPRAVEMPAGWIPGWNTTLLAVAPFRESCSHSIVLGRNGGPGFLDSEIARLRHLAALADAH